VASLSSCDQTLEESEWMPRNLQALERVSRRTTDKRANVGSKM